MAAISHFRCPKFTFDCISDHFRSIVHFGYTKFTFDSNSGHFRSIQNFFFRRPFWMSENHFQSHFWPFQIHTDHNTNKFDKMAAGGHYGWDDNVNYRTCRDIWMINACVKFEERSLNPSKVIALTTKLWRGGGGRRSGGCVAEENIIFPKTYVSREYNYITTKYNAKSNISQIHNPQNKTFNLLAQ